MMQPYQSKIADAKPTSTNISTLPPQLSTYSLCYEIHISLTHVLIPVTIHTLLVMKIICRMETSWGWEKYLSRPGFPSVKIMESRRKQAAHCNSLVQQISYSVEVVHDTECVIYMESGVGYNRTSPLSVPIARSFWRGS